MALIVCEIGQNHCGDMELAKQLIRLAKENGADLAKFQLYDHKKLYGDKPVPNVELSFEQAKMLFDYGKEIGIEVFFSVFDVERVQWCEKIGVRRYKLACRFANDKPLLGAVWATEMPVYISLTYPQYSVELEPPNVHYLMCVSKYPALTKDYLIYNDPAYRAFYRGISDHTIGLDAAKIALARGAQIIEKHFAIDHKTGVDAEWSMAPDELRELKRWEQVCQTVLQ